jgi:hypothetical protein
VSPGKAPSTAEPAKAWFQLTGTSSKPIASTTKPLTWYNACLACNGTPGAHSCCLVCRNYDDIDELALRLTIKDTPIDGGEGMSMAESLRGPCKTARRCRQALDDADQAVKKC